MQKTNSKKYCVGIDVGSVSLNCIVVNSNKDVVFEFPYRRHFGKIEEEMLDLVARLFEKFEENQIQSISFTGNHGKKLSEKFGTFYEFESISQKEPERHSPRAKSWMDKVREFFAE